MRLVEVEVVLYITPPAAAFIFLVPPLSHLFFTTQLVVGGGISTILGGGLTGVVLVFLEGMMRWPLVTGFMALCMMWVGLWGGK